MSADSPATDAAPLATIDPARASGRRIAIICFYSLVVIFTLMLAGEVTWQVFTGTGSAPAADCRSGLRELVRSVEAGRAASETAGNHPEEALARFRAALSPSWDGRDAIEGACKRAGDPTFQAAFDTIERLRYAEENAVRRDARDLAPLRRKVEDLLAGQLADPPARNRNP